MKMRQLAASFSISNRRLRGRSKNAFALRAQMSLSLDFQEFWEAAHRRRIRGTESATYAPVDHDSSINRGSHYYDSIATRATERPDARSLRHQYRQVGRDHTEAKTPFEGTGKRRDATQPEAISPLRQV